MFTVPRPYPWEFREDVIRVARNRGPGVRIKDVAADFGISESCLTNWMTQADRDERTRAGRRVSTFLRQVSRRISVL
jgi:transposase